MLQPHPRYPPRAPVRQVDWALPDPDYAPVDFTHPKVLSSKHADPEEFTPRLLEDRVSCAMLMNGPVPTDPETGRPRNPMGRTGMVGRGVLPRYGPNFASTPQVTTRFAAGELQVMVKRCDDTQCLTLPHKDELVAAGLWSMIPIPNLPVLAQGEEFGGYMEDVRNTDEAWVEVVCRHVHLELALLAATLQMESRDGRSTSEWVNVSDEDPDYNALGRAYRSLVLKALRLKPRKFGAALAKTSFN